MSHPRLHRVTGFIALAALLVGTLHAPAAAAPPPTVLTIGDVSITEGDTGVKILIFTVVQKGKRAPQATVDYATENNSAKAGSDYEHHFGTLAFSGSRRLEIRVPIIGDTTTELTETFSVNLTNASGAGIQDPQGLGTIIDNDTAPTLSISDQTVGEGDAGLTTASFLVTLSEPSTVPVSVDYSTANGTATVLGLDYATANGHITFDPGETSKTIDVNVIGDVVTEGTETFTVTLATPSNAQIGDGTAIGTIIDDEGSPVVSVGDATSVGEGDSGTTAVQFEVTLSRASTTQVSVNYSTAAGSAKSPDDFVAVPTTPLNFEAGTTTKPVTVQVVGDLTDESDELLHLALDTPQGAIAGDMQGSGLILDDDTTRVSVNDKSVTEGNAASARFELSLSAPSSKQVVVDYDTVDGSANAGADYESRTGSVTFAPNDAGPATIAVPIVDDEVAESLERFSFRVTATSNANLADGVGTATIHNDDRDQSATKVNAAKRQGRIKVRGRLTPEHPTKRMKVTLKKRKGGRWVKVRTKRPRLSAGVDVNGD